MCKLMKIYMDLDDTVKDTERYIRKVLDSNGVNTDRVSGSVYGFIGSCSLENTLIKDCFDNWDVIPFKSCAYNAIKLLQTEYEVVFCSAYTFNKEYELKKSFAKSLGCEIILCGEGNKYKDKVDMSGSIFVDDRSEILVRSNADIKYELYNPYYFDKYAERDEKTLVVDWYSLVDILLNKGTQPQEGGNLIEKFRGYLCQRV